VRQAKSDDLEQIVALQVDRNGPTTDELVRVLWLDPGVGPERFTVAEAGGRIVSSLCLMNESTELEGIVLPTGQVEFVATATDYEHFGLVRQQMDLVHDWSRARGDLVQVIAGIPYFYRRFGYEYAIAFPRVRLVTPGLQPTMPAGWSVRDAVDTDLVDITRMQDEVQRLVPLVGRRSERWWRWHLRAGGGWHVAVKDGVVRGAAAYTDGPPGVYDVSLVGSLAAERQGAVVALVAGAAERGKPVAIRERAGPTTSAYGISHRHPRAYSWYVRVEDVVAVLDRIRPVLTARLRRSPRANTSGRLLLSFYSRSLAIVYERGEVIAIESGGSVQDPASRGRGGVGVPPDLAATLLFGRYGAADLEERFADVDLGVNADLMEIFFPPLANDLLFAL
jgi:hypothetical protein